MSVLHRAAMAAVLMVALSLPLLLPPAPTMAHEPDPAGVWPLQPEPEVVRGFDPPDIAWASGHRGVDLLGAPGQSVHAALPGVVTFAGTLAGRGVLVVSHGDTRTTYEPVTASVEVGTVVPRGAVIGSLALAGSHCLPRACLHWGWLRGKTYLDPLRLVGTGAIRLLPLWGGQQVAAGRPHGLMPWPASSWLSPYAEVLWRLAEVARSPPGTPWPRAP